MTLPLRIQRRRTRGWKMPANTVYVGRQSLWGNPFVIGVDGTREQCIALYAGLFHGMLCVSKRPEHVEMQRRVIAQLQTVDRLAGKQLCCWCAPGERCHADVLLHLANKVQLPEAWLPRFTRVG